VVPLYFAVETVVENAERIAEWPRTMATLALWFVAQVGSIGLLLVQFLLTVIIAAILYANGETAARGADRFARQLAGPRGVNMVLPHRRFEPSPWASS